MNRTSTTAAPTLTIKRTFNASRARVFAALTQPALISQWFAPDGRQADVQWDARTGGRYRVTMLMEDGEAYIVTGTFSAVRAPEHLAFSFRWIEDDPALERDTFVTIDLIDRGSQTDLELNQTNFRDEDSRNSHDGGWNAAFTNLERVIAAPVPGS